LPIARCRKPVHCEQLNRIAKDGHVRGLRQSTLSMDTVCRLEDELADAVATVAQVHDTGLVEPAAELFAVGDRQ
jgi:hypothetical protein